MTDSWIDKNLELIRQLQQVSGPTPTCLVTDCERTTHTHGLCKAHYHRARRSFDPKYTDSRSNNRKDN
jgi:hypothetical protein